MSDSRLMLPRFHRNLAVVVSLLFLGDAQADLIPPGHKSIKHQLVFLDSPLLTEHRLIAAPVRGFGGFSEVKAGHPFYFSSKYGTKIYAVPKDYQPPTRYSPGEALPFPHSEPPTNSITSVSLLQNTSRIETHCRLVAVTETSLEIEVTEEIRFDELNNVTTGGLSLLGKIAISLVGLGGCLALWIVKKFGKRQNSTEGQMHCVGNSQTSE